MVQFFKKSTYFQKTRNVGAVLLEDGNSINKGAIVGRTCSLVHTWCTSEVEGLSTGHSVMNKLGV